MIKVPIFSCQIIMQDTSSELQHLDYLYVHVKCFETGHFGLYQEHVCMVTGRCTIFFVLFVILFLLHNVVKQCDKLHSITNLISLSLC